MRICGRLCVGQKTRAPLELGWASAGLRRIHVGIFGVLRSGRRPFPCLRLTCGRPGAIVRPPTRIVPTNPRESDGTLWKVCGPPWGPRGAPAGPACFVLRFPVWEKRPLPCACLVGGRLASATYGPPCKTTHGGFRGNDCGGLAWGFCGASAFLGRSAVVSVRDACANEWHRAWLRNRQCFKLDQGFVLRR